MKKNILVTAYAVNPFKGSEDGTGWNILRHLAAQNQVVAITRCNNRHDIERYFSTRPQAEGESLQFEYFDLPGWLSFWKKGGKGALPYHYLWHLGVVFFILKKRLRFDLAHHLNFHSDWSPTFLWLLGKPFVWGPLGHHHKIPRAFILPYGKKAWLHDRLMWWAKRLFWTFDPFLKISKWTAAKVIGVNSSVFKMLRVPAGKGAVIPAVATETPDIQSVETEKFQILTIGRFVPLKGFDVAIRAFADCYHRQPADLKSKLQLTLIGKGPEETRLKNLAKACRLPADAIRFVDWLSRDQLAQFFASSKLFIFPSHEGAGMVVPEALSYGLPVLCFDNFGPGENVDNHCAIRIPYSDYDTSVAQFSTAIEKLLQSPPLLDLMSKNAVRHYQERFTWERKAQQIQAVYDSISIPARATMPAPYPPLQPIQPIQPLQPLQPIQPI